MAKRELQHYLSCFLEFFPIRFGRFLTNYDRFSVNSAPRESKKSLKKLLCIILQFPPKIVFFLTIMLVTLLMIKQTAAKEAEYEEDIIIGEQECLQLMSSNRGFGSQYQLKFFNSCPIGIWAKICVEERPGKFKLHTSSRKIPKYGYMEVFTYESAPPVSVSWISGQSIPGKAPGQCGADGI